MKVSSRYGVYDKLKLFLIWRAVNVFRMVEAFMALLAGFVAKAGSHSDRLLYAEHDPLSPKLYFLAKDYPRKVADDGLLDC